MSETTLTDAERRLLLLLAAAVKGIVFDMQLVRLRYPHGSTVLHGVDAAAQIEAAVDAMTAEHGVHQL